MSPQNALLLMWVVFTFLALAGVAAVIVWAVRTRQFADQERARHLPLRSGFPEDEAGPESESGEEEAR